MKQKIFEFFRRGFIACGLGPMVLAVVYLISQNQGVLTTLPVEQVCRGIFSLTALAFIAGGMNVIYQIERLPLMIAILIHGGVLYISYLGTYLLNGWLDRGKTSIFVFSAIFVFTFLVIWAVIYYIIRKRTKMLNETLKQKQKFLWDIHNE